VTKKLSWSRFYCPSVRMNQFTFRGGAQIYSKQVGEDLRSTPDVRTTASQIKSLERFYKLAKLLHKGTILHSYSCCLLTKRIR